MWCFVHRIAMDYVSVYATVGAEGQFHVGSNEDEPGPTGKMIKHSTSTRLLKTFGRIKSFTIAFNRLALLKKVY